MREGSEILRVVDLQISLIGQHGLTRIVEVTNMSVQEGETVGLIGPTGAGKSILAKAIMGILQPVGKPLWEVNGEIFFKGKDLLRLSEEDLTELRGNELAIVFQNPGSSMNPIQMIGRQTGEPVEAHEEVEMRRLREIVIDYLGKVELPNARRRSRFFPHQFSGGEAQRIMIAMALICRPSLLIADEPTSDLDVTIQRQVLELLKRVKKEFDLGMLLITHDLGVIAEMSDYVYVLYAGRIIEHGDVYTIFGKPGHPYTRGLMRSVPRIDMVQFELEGIPGDPPQPPYDIPGCIFHPRCKHIMVQCKKEIPTLQELDTGHYIACLRSREI